MKKSVVLHNQAVWYLDQGCVRQNIMEISQSREDILLIRGRVNIPLGLLVPEY